jgi:hypothetical protein
MGAEDKDHYYSEEYQPFHNHLYLLYLLFCGNKKSRIALSLLRQPGCLRIL